MSLQQIQATMQVVLLFRPPKLGDTEELEIFVIEEHTYTTENYTPFTKWKLIGYSAMREILTIEHQVTMQTDLPLQTGFFETHQIMW